MMIVIFPIDLNNYLFTIILLLLSDYVADEACGEKKKHKAISAHLNSTFNDLWSF